MLRCVVVVFTSMLTQLTKKLSDSSAPSPAPWSCWCRGCPVRRGTAGAHRNRAAPAPPPPALSSPAALHPPRLLTSGHSALKRCLVIGNLSLLSCPAALTYLLVLLGSLLPLLLLYEPPLLVQLVLPHVGGGEAVHPADIHIIDQES